MDTALPEPEIASRKAKAVCVILPIKDYEEPLALADEAGDAAWPNRAGCKLRRNRPWGEYPAELPGKRLSGEPLVNTVAKQLEAAGA